jgi:hypothetical protein
MRVHYNFYPGRSADGMSIDTQGNLYASAGMNQLRGTTETLDTKTGIYVISPQGKLLKFIPIPEDFITNNAFGGPDMKTLYVTAGKTLYKVRMDVAGLPRWSDAITGSSRSFDAPASSSDPTSAPPAVADAWNISESGSNRCARQ